MIKVELTERELNCLISFMEVDEDILKEMKEDDPSDNPEEYCNVILSLLNKLRDIRRN
jgi:hypothetical protein